MSKLWNKLRWVIARPSLCAILLFLPLCTAICHAQCYEPPAGQAPQITLSPTFWAPGQTYNVVLTNPQGYFVPYTPPAGDLPATFYVLTSASYNAGIYYAEDPNVTVTLPVLVSPTEITFTVTVSGSAPIESDGFGLVCLGNTLTGGTGYISITPCALSATPALSSIVPNAFFAGASTNVAITGSGFMPTSNPNNCIPSQLSVTAGTETVALSNVNVLSPTEVTATVAPLEADPDETASATVSNYIYNGPPYYTPSNALSPEILPVPTIQWNNNPISGPGTQAQPAVVGQEIYLTTAPTSLLALPSLQVHGR